jgi:hypothetical protein
LRQPGYIFLLLLCAPACGSGVQLNLIVNDPCSQSVLADVAFPIRHIELEIWAPDLAAPEGAIWNREDGQGEMLELTPVEQATVSVIGRGANASGDLGDPLAATSVGRIDLSGADGNDVVDLDVMIGKVDTFVYTTDTPAASDGAARCTRLVAERRGHTASLLPDGRVFVAGGERVNANSVTYWETTELYDPVTGAFEQGPAMTWVRKSHTATVLDDGRVLIAGGVGLNGTIVDTWQVALLYDPASNSFATPVAMKYQRANHTATLLGDGRVLIAGGTVGSRELQTTEIFDPRTASTCAGPTLSEPRAYHGAARVGQQGVALIGGQGSGRVLGSIEFVSVGGCTEGTSQPGPSLNVARSHPMVGVIPGSDAILVVGGFSNAVTDEQHGTAVSDIELIDVNRQNVAASTVRCSGLSLAEARGAAALVSLPDGFLVAGGVGASSQVLGSAERIRFDDVGACDAAIESTAGALGMPRGGPVGTALVGGDVLITGGFAREGGDLVSLAHGEIYVRQR